MRNSTSAPPSVPSDDRVESSDELETQEHPESERPSRRSFFFFGAMAAASLLPNTAKAQQIRSRARRPTVPRQATEEFRTAAVNERPAAFSEWTADAASVSRLVRRVTMGVTAADMAKATQLGWQGYLNWQLNYGRINDDFVENTVATRYPLVLQTSDQLGLLTDFNPVYQQLRESTIYRAAFSQRQLFQRMVEFWTDHFNQDLDKVGYFYVADLRDVIRKNALGRFPDMLRASAHSASMMAYLDQNASRSGAPNQNYARELMELHTLGVDAG